MPDRRALSFGAIGLLLGLAAGFGVWRRPLEVSDTAAASIEAKLTPVVAPVAGALAPEFEAIDVDGGRFLLREARGQPLVLNFWATWCEPCRAEMALLEARYRGEEPGGLLVVGINPEESMDEARAFRDSLGLTFPVVTDPGGEIRKLYRVRGYPTTFFVDEAGLIRFQQIGGMSEEVLGGYLQGMGMD